MQIIMQPLDYIGTPFHKVGNLNRCQPIPKEKFALSHIITTQGNEKHKNSLKLNTGKNMIKNRAIYKRIKSQRKPRLL